MLRWGEPAAGVGVGRGLEVGGQPAAEHADVALGAGELALGVFCPEGAPGRDGLGLGQCVLGSGRGPSEPELVCWAW